MQDVGIYCHVPFCKHRCPYCDFYVLELRERPARSRLELPLRFDSELDLVLKRLPDAAARPLATIYFGGGTPSTLSPAGVADFIARVRTRFAGGEPEVTLEANPENLTPARAAKWRAAGVNRLSIGVQSFDARELRLLERLHPPEAIEAAVGNARAAGFENLSLDLMFALPGQSIDTWRANLRRAVELSPQHVSFYGLTYHEDTAFDAWRRAGRLSEVDDEQQAEMYLWGAEFLESAGFEHYEISNFARPGCRSRHNQRYWSRADVLALGPGAHGNAGDLRWANPKDLERWAAAVDAGHLAWEAEEQLSPGTAAAERLFTGLRRAEGIARTEAPDLFAACIAWAAREQPESARLMAVEPERVRLTREGWLVSDAIIGAINVP